MRDTPARILFPLSLILWALSVVFVFANGPQVSQPSDAPLKQLSLEALGNIEVTTASKEPQEVRRSPAAIFVITRDDIRRSGATSLPEVLRLAPGVDVARIDADHWSVGVRGFGDQFSKSVLVLIDGRSVYTPLFAGVQWGVQDTVLGDIERIEVIRGPGGTIWGANAVNGIVSIITANAKDTQGTALSVGGGSVDHAIASARYGGKGGEAFDYRVYAKGSDLGPQFHSDHNNFDGSRMGQAGFRADWTRDRDSLTVQGDLYTGHIGQSVALAFFAPPSQTIAVDSLNVAGGNVLARWRRGLAGNSDVQLQAYYDGTTILGPQVGESRHTFDVDFIHHVAQAPRQAIIWGLGGRVSPSHITQTVATLDIAPHDRTENIYSAFAQDEITLPTNRLWLTIGSKLEHNGYTGVEVQPTARLLWAPTTTQSVWTAVTRAVRTPSGLEEGLQLTGFLAANPPTFVRVLGNSSFGSERLTAYEAGYRTAVTPRFYTDVSIFHNQFEDLESLGPLSVAVETTPPPSHTLLVFSYANGVMGTSNGVEVSPNWQPTPWLHVKGSYSYLHVTLQNQPGNTDVSAVATYEGSSPRHQVLFQSLLTFPGGWEVDPAYRYVSALPARQVDAYSSVDVRLGWHATDRIEVSATGQNLADDDHVEFAHDPGPQVAIKRAVFVSITWRQ